MADNPGPTLIRALGLPLRDVHDICATGDVDYLTAFAKDEEHRANKGLGRPYSASRKATSPVRRAEYLQGSKLAEKARKEAEERELAQRQRKREENRRRRRAEAEAAARADGGGDYQSDAGGSQAGDSARGGRGAAAADQQQQHTDEDQGNYDDEEYEGEDEQQRGGGRNKKNSELLLSVGAGSTDKDRVPVDTVFPRPRLGRSNAAASEDAMFNTVGLGVVSVADLVSFRDEHGLLPIHTACVFGHSLVVDFLVERGADIESVVPGSLFRPLHLAVLNGHDQLARRLVETYSADPGALTADLELPLTLAKRRRVADLQLYFKDKCKQRLASSNSSKNNALFAAREGNVLFFAFHAECDEDSGRKCFTEDYASARPTDKAESPAPGATGVSIEALIRDPVSTPLDIVIASMTTTTAPAAAPTTDKKQIIPTRDNRDPHSLIAEILLRGKYFKLNELRESPIATTTLYLAVSVPTRDGIEMLLKHGADPRVASVFNAAPTQVLKLKLAEAEAKVVFEEFYATRDDVSFEERAEYTDKVVELRNKWRRAKRTLEKALDREEAIAAANAAAAGAAE